MITHKELLKILSYNALTGIFRWKIKPADSIQIGDIAGSMHKITGYIEIGINKKVYLGHRLAWFYYYGYWPENDIDHRNQKKHCNWILNLREASKQCNARNSKNRTNNTSGVKGVCWAKHVGKWEAIITINYKNKSLGFYKEFDNAVCARLAGEQCLN